MELNKTQPRPHLGLLAKSAVLWSYNRVALAVCRNSYTYITRVRVAGAAARPSGGGDMLLAICYGRGLHPREGRETSPPTAFAQHDHNRG